MKTDGILIFAQNNKSVDYVKLATFAARRASYYLNLPVSLVTDSAGWLETSQPDHPFDEVISIESSASPQFKTFSDGSLSSTQLEWKNYSRNQAFELSPYYKTLVIDSDYIISSDLLLKSFSRDTDLQIYSSCVDLANWRNPNEFKRINNYSVPFYWATAFVFEKTKSMQAFFDLVAYIKLNWEYYRMIYNIDSVLFRNDFAFSIAINIMNNKTGNGFAIDLPGKMNFIKDTDILVDIDNENMHFLLEKKDHRGEYIASKTSGLDVHVMNKFSLGRFIDGGAGV